MMELLLRMQAQMAATEARAASTDERMARMEAAHARALSEAANRARVDGSTLEGLDLQRVEEEAQQDAAADSGDERKQRATEELERTLEADARRLAAPASGSSGMRTPLPNTGTAAQPRPVPATPLSQRPLWESDLRQQPRAGAGRTLLPGAPAASAPLGTPRGLEPNELKEEHARKPGVLEEWIFTVERAITARGQETAPYSDKRKYATMYLDRGATMWWRGHEQMLAEQGMPVVDWESFTRVLREHYTPVADEDTASRKLFSLRMQAGETMAAYVMRAAELFNRTTRARMPSHIAAERLEDGVEAQRFPFAVRDLQERQQRHRAAHQGVGESFEQVSAFLQQAAAREPSQQQRASGGPAAGAATHSSAGRGHAGSNRARINQLLQELAAEGEEEDEEAAREQRVAPVQSAPAPCRKCGSSGHGSWQCTSKKDLRQCYECKKVGHIKPDCPTLKSKAAAAPTSTSTPAASKNE